MELNLSNRIKQVRKYLNIGSQAKLAELLGTDRSKIADIESGRVQKMPLDIAVFLMEKYHIDGWWLMTGIGSMLHSVAKIENEVYEIEILDLKASAGTGIENFETEAIGKLVLDKNLFKTPPIIDNIKMIKVEGDSMEPTIQDGAYVVIDRGATDKVDGIYACLLDDSIIIKRLEFELNGSIKIISDNTRYATKIYNPKESEAYFQILGRKILTIQK